MGGEAPAVCRAASSCRWILFPHRDCNCRKWPSHKSQTLTCPWPQSLRAAPENTGREVSSKATRLGCAHARLWKLCCAWPCRSHVGKRTDAVESPKTTSSSCFPAAPLNTHPRGLPHDPATLRLRGQKGGLPSWRYLIQVLPHNLPHAWNSTVITVAQQCALQGFPWSLHEANRLISRFDNFSIDSVGMASSALPAYQLSHSWLLSYSPIRPRAPKLVALKGSLSMPPLIFGALSVALVLVCPLGSLLSQLVAVPGRRPPRCCCAKNCASGSRAA